MKKTSIITALLSLLLSLGIEAQTVQQADSLHQRGRELLEAGQFAEGRECTRAAMQIRRQLLGEVSEDYITSLNNYALTYMMEQDFQQALNLQKQVIALCDKLPSAHPNLGLYLTNLGRYYYFTDDKTNAAVAWERALPLVEKHGEVYEFLITGLSQIYSDAQDQQNIMRIMALEEEHNRHELEKPCDEPKCMMERALYYRGVGNSAMARDCFLRLLNMEMDDEMKVKVYSQYASFMGLDQRDFATAGEYMQMAAALQLSIGGESQTYADLCTQEGQMHFIAKHYLQAIEAYSTAYSYYKSHPSDQVARNAVICLKGIGNAYSAQKDYTSACNYYRQLVAHYEQNDTTDEEYPKAILRLAKAEKYGHDFTPSIEHHLQAMAIFDARGMSSDYTEAAASLQTCYIMAGMNEEVDMRYEASREARIARIDTIIAEELEGLELTRTYLGQRVYAHSLATLGGCYAMKEEYATSLDYYQQYVTAAREALRDEFRLKAENDRMLIWNEDKSNIEELMELLLELPRDSFGLRSAYSATAYDAQLLAKGILLNSSIEFEKVLNAQPDNNLKRIYAQSKANETEIDRLRASLSSEADLDKILELTRQNQALLLELYRGCAELADFTNYISYTWQDVQHALRKDDVAIEFACIGRGALDSDKYLIALALTNRMAQPATVTICSLKELRQLEQEADIFSTPDAGNAIWGPLEQYLGSSRRVFFSADGALNRIAIEYLQYRGTQLSESKEVYRLSSTKELCYSHKHGKLAKAAIFGDISYDELSTHSDGTRQAVAALRGSAGSGGFANLENTQREINDILSILRQHGVTKALQFRDTEASREAFLALSDTQVNLLHIATHGMYTEVHSASESQSMTNSLLAFAGANVDEAGAGIVTAADIAAMNLRLCDLAVLSACETGLGKLGGDGVFGLQRGFKNAGVHTLLMSLKPVYDESTADMMVGFYTYLMDGASKREALVRAQRDLRAAGKTEPRYWATFILLDAYDN